MDFNGQGLDLHHIGFSVLLKFIWNAQSVYIIVKGVPGFEIARETGTNARKFVNL